MSSTTSSIDGASSTFSSITALGGSGGEAVTATTTNIGGIGGSGGIGSTNGGNGGSATDYNGDNTNTQPGGGGSGGTTNDGSSGLNWQTTENVTTGGLGGSSGGGSGANGAANSANNGLIGNIPGGGGSGAYGAASTSQRSGGAGARGQIRITYTPLPIKIQSFEVFAKNNKSVLNLITASETNNDFFTIERSADGRNFDAIGEIKGAGNSSEELTYEFIDDSPLLGINYYRIKQTDFDGKYSYTEIKSVRHRGTASVTISPRSTEGRLDITTAMEDYSMVVYNGGGQEVQRFDALSGDQSVSIDALQAGIYFIKVTNGSESETLRIVKF